MAKRKHSHTSSPAHDNDYPGLLTKQHKPLYKLILEPETLIAGLIVLALVVFASFIYYQSTQDELFSERSAHLTEIANKVADQIDTVMDVGLESAAVGSAYMEEAPLPTRDALFERLDSLQKSADQAGSLFLVFDTEGNYYASNGRSGTWTLTGGVLDTKRDTCLITSLPYDPINTYMLMMHHVDKPIVVGQTGIQIAAIAIASNMKTVQDMMAVEGFGSQCMTYIVSPENKRIYQHTFGQRFIPDTNIMTTLSEYRFVKGGDAQTLQQAIAEQKTECMEFVNGDGTNYYVAITGVGKDSLLLFVPTDVLSKNEGSYLLSTMGYFTVVAVLLVVCMGYVVTVVIRSRADEKIIEKQSEANKKLELARDKAEQASRAKTEFLSNMSHDIRTPMNAIIGFTTLARDHIDDKERVDDYLGKIESSSNHLLSLINDILDMSKIEHGKIQLRYHDCDLAIVLNELLVMVADQAEKKGLVLESHVHLHHTLVNIDPLRLNQILLNIVGNAIKYTEPGGHVYLSVEERPLDPGVLPDPDLAGQDQVVPLSSKEGSTYCFVVRDTGIGMKEEYLPEIFDAFSRERNTTVSRIQGTGLGLAITKRLVEMMQGTIEVSSVLGEGTTFTVTIPMKFMASADEFMSAETRAFVESLTDSDSEQRGAEPLSDPTSTDASVSRDLSDSNGTDDAREATPSPEHTSPQRTAQSVEMCQCDHLSASDMPQELSAIKQQILADEHITPGITIPLLLAEDNDLNAMIATGLLEDKGFSITWVKDGKAAVDAMKAADPSTYALILMDAQMPVMGGHEAARLIRALDDEACANIPIIALTADAFEEDKQKAFAAGMNAHVPKPLNAHELFVTIVMLLPDELLS